MKQKLFTGVATALITPFQKDGSVDHQALKNLVNWQIDCGIDALVALGTTAEAATMTHQEWCDVLACVVETVNHRVPVIAGTGGNNTQSVIEKAKAAKEIGADGQLCVTPYYNKATQQGLIAHYTNIHDATDLPIILYNVPSRTGMTVKPETVHALSKLPRIAGIKEASGDAGLAGDILSLCGEDMPLYSGSDEITLPLRAIGGSGVISVLSNVAPRMMLDICHKPLEEAGQYQLAAMKLIRLLFSEVNPIPVKSACHHLGLCENVLRLPLTPMEKSNEEKLIAEMERLNVRC
ncbi:MAG: 4-hydroxy-tetrahydrodipicolinate synthase [Clostridiales bacterium]|nr:4-hydroxy-tetrahydrodipicolinate synthase [Clostridiales bacterium]